MLRRDLLKSLGLLATGPAVLQLAAAEPGAPKFFSKPDFEMLDQLTEIIIPADDHSPGAHAAGVAAYIDEFVARSFLPEEKTEWTKGLAATNSLCQELHHKPWAQASDKQRADVLKHMSRAEDHPKSDAEKFWGQLKQTTAWAYYTSKVGIHDDIDYKGNVILEQFAGYEVT